MKPFPLFTSLVEWSSTILPKGFQRIRYYGFHSNVRYEQMRTKIQLLVPPKTNTRSSRIPGYYLENLFSFCSRKPMAKTPWSVRRAAILCSWNVSGTRSMASSKTWCTATTNITILDRQCPTSTNLTNGTILRGMGQANGTHTTVVHVNAKCGSKTSLLMHFHPMDQAIALSSSALNVEKDFLRDIAEHSIMSTNDPNVSH